MHIDKKLMHRVNKKNLYYCNQTATFTIQYQTCLSGENSIYDEIFAFGCPRSQPLVVTRPINCLPLPLGPLPQLMFFSSDLFFVVDHETTSFKKYLSCNIKLSLTKKIVTCDRGFAALDSIL